MGDSGARSCSCERSTCNPYAAASYAIQRSVGLFAPDPVLISWRPPLPLGLDLLDSFLARLKSAHISECDPRNHVSLTRSLPGMDGDEAEFSIFAP